MNLKDFHSFCIVNLTFVCVYFVDQFSLSVIQYYPATGYCTKVKIYSDYKLLIILFSLPSVLVD